MADEVALGIIEAVIFLAIVGVVLYVIILICAAIWGGLFLVTQGIAEGISSSKPRKEPNPDVPTWVAIASIAGVIALPFLLALFGVK